jgi:hypothetical protein
MYSVHFTRVYLAGPSNGVQVFDHINKQTQHDAMQLASGLRQLVSRDSDGSMCRYQDIEVVEIPCANSSTI